MTQNIRETLAAVRPLLGGSAAFTAGNSLLGVVLPLRMEAADYPVALIGAIMAAYYMGLAFGGLRAKHVILRIGHIRAFSAMATAGAPDGAALAAGISEALINTALGIGTSAIAIISYNFFTTIIDGITFGIDESGFTLTQNFVANYK